MAFITNFNPKDYDLYAEAVRKWKRPKDFAVSRLSHDKKAHSGSLHFFGEGDLSEFWRHFDTIQALCEQRKTP